MKKVIFALFAVMAFAFTSCQNEATFTVSVKDTEGDPVADRYVFFKDKASMIADFVLPPTPEELLGAESGWSYVITNRAGVVDVTFNIGFSKATYYFYVFDNGSQQWKEKEVVLVKGQNEPIDFVVNR